MPLFHKEEKKAKKLISQQFSSELVTSIYSSMDLDEGIRAENLSIEQYVEFLRNF